MTGCWNDIIVASLYKNAQDVSQLYSFLGFPGPTGPNGSPAVGGTLDVGITNGPSSPLQAYLIGPQFDIGGNAVSNELVFGLYNTSKNYWLYSGNSPLRNGNPLPNGIQNILLNVTGQVVLNGNNFGTPGNVYLLGWEDLNGNCTGGSTAQSVAWSTIAPPGGGIGGGGVIGPLDTGILSGCTKAPNGTDNDFNDFYILLSVNNGTGTTTSVVPEPMTMSLMALGLVAMSGASLRRRKKKLA
jgi:hypothetical protein